VGREPNSLYATGRLERLEIQAEMQQKTIDQLCREHESILELAAKVPQ